MSVVAVVEPPGTSAATTTGLLLAAAMPEGHPVVFAECDPSGGDVASWAQLRESPGWSTAVASGDRSWAGLQANLQQLPSRMNVLVAPTHAGQAGVVVSESARRFSPLLASMPDVTVVADCGRMVGDVPVWVRAADVVLLVVRQAPLSEGATVAHVDRAGECLDVLRASGVSARMVVIGARPYPPHELADVLHADVFAVLPEDASGAALAAGAWTVGRGAWRSALARAVRPAAARLVEVVGGLGAVVPIRDASGSEAAG